MGMKEQDKNKRLKNNLKNSRAKIKRRDERIAQLEARIVQMQEESKKNVLPDIWIQCYRV